jgi:YYY domain-containing protein
MVVAFLSWYAIVTALGWAVFPAAFRLLPGLPDRGYALSRGLGLLATGYVFWLLGSLGLLNNTLGAQLLAAVFVLGIAIWIYRRAAASSDAIVPWLRRRLALVLGIEVLFVAAFAGWAVARAYNPHVFYTEKLMELAFLNGVRASPAFPPRDPWLAGYAISYYYFGYVIIAMLADLAGTPTDVAFNLGIALLFALTLVASYGLVYNLIAHHVQRTAPDRPARGARLAALLGPLFVGVMGNLAGLLELLRALNLPFLGASFWAWLDIADMEAPTGAGLWPPGTWRFWWWFRASRVIQDRDVAGTAIGLQPIDEFPFFSFLLGDMHPHVLALPFVIVALTLAFNALVQRDRLSRPQIGLLVLVFGGLAFLNTWDLPIYLFVLFGALALRHVAEHGWLSPGTALRPAATVAGVLALGVLAYLPWYASFGSQAGGILPNPIFATRLHQLIVMFGLLLAVVIPFLVDAAVRSHAQANWGGGLLAGAAVLAGLIIIAAGLSVIALRADPAVRQFAVTSAGLSSGQLPQEQIDALVPQAARAIAAHRLQRPLTSLLLAGLIAVSSALLLRRAPAPGRPSGMPDQAESPSGLFALLLILTACLLTLGPEFVYLRDNFGQRINTIFKFYFAAWILLAIAAAYGASVLLSRGSRVARAAFGIVLAICAAAGLVYPVLAIPAISRDSMRAQDSQPPTLEGLSWLARRHPDDYAGIVWLQQNAGPGDVVLEAIGGSYSYHARVSSTTGIPTLMGWPGHEGQWRGPRYAEFAGSRVADVQEIYSTTSIERARELLDFYGVTYVFVGSLERDAAYAPAAGLDKFARFLSVAFQAEGVVIYRADRPLVEGSE